MEYPQVFRGQLSQRADRQERLIKLGMMAGTPSFVIIAAAMRDKHWPALEQTAAAVDEESKQGIALLKQVAM